MRIGFDFTGIAWVDIDEEELEDNDIDIDDEEAVIDFAWEKARNYNYTIGGEPIYEVIDIDRD